MYDAIIVGAGPAGMSAALYLLRANKKVLILEKRSYGGQIINTNKIENYPAIKEISGFEFATNLYNQIKDLGCEVKYEEVVNINDKLEVISNKNKYSTKAIILATGTIPRKLNITDEDKYIGKGISYCATCDGAFYKNKNVCVVGGGNTALEDALYLSDICKEIYLVHRREIFRGDNKYIDELKRKKNVKFILNSKIKSLQGKETLSSIEIIDNDNNTSKINIDGLFVAIGTIPVNDKFKDIVDLDENGYFSSSDGVHTKIKNIYVAGDARAKDLRQLTTATADGAIAATIALKEMK